MADQQGKQQQDQPKDPSPKGATVYHVHTHKTEGATSAPPIPPQQPPFVFMTAAPSQGGHAAHHPHDNDGFWKAAALILFLVVGGLALLVFGPWQELSKNFPNSAQTQSTPINLMAKVDHATGDVAEVESIRVDAEAAMAEARKRGLPLAQPVLPPPADPFSEQLAGGPPAIVSAPAPAFLITAGTGSFNGGSVESYEVDAQGQLVRTN